jgi:hypothetical protein
MQHVSNPSASQRSVTFSVSSAPLDLIDTLQRPCDGDHKVPLLFFAVVPRNGEPQLVEFSCNSKTRTFNNRADSSTVVAADLTGSNLGPEFGKPQNCTRAPSPEKCGIRVQTSGHPRHNARRNSVSTCEKQQLLPNGHTRLTVRPLSWALFSFAWPRACALLPNASSVSFLMG